MIVILTILEATQEIDGCLHFTTTTGSIFLNGGLYQLNRKILASSHGLEMLDCGCDGAGGVIVVLASNIDIILAHINTLLSADTRSVPPGASNNIAFIPIP